MYIRTLALLLAVSFNVHAASGHNHGVGKLDVSVDGEQLTLELELPLDADIDAHYVFRCATPTLLKSVETGLFKHFKRLYRIETRSATPAGQGAARLSARQAVIAW